MTQDSKQVKSYKINYETIKELVSEYNRIKLSGEIKRYNEETTKKDFILPLFEALGWNISNRANRDSSVSAEETISKKRVDYGFRINGIPKFYLEAKSLKEEDIQNNGKYVLQAIDYAWMKSCSWAILTNFETIAVYNADWKSPYYNGNLFFVLHPNDFLTDDRFKKLSKESFEENELDKEALKYGKKQLKNRIDKQLLEDMIHFREILSKDIMKNNQDKHLSQEDLDESVQMILDRLIFIRNAEDRELEENRLQSDLRQWLAKGKGELIKEISKVYSYFDDKYNSKLFSKHLCDDLYIDNDVLLEVIEGLNHSKDNSYRYDFSIIESDVLGNIYEQYLGNILKTTPKRAKLESSKVHRKEQGIYYTPSYIVDYIVKNTVGEYIKTHTPEEIENVKILDPACGSGSFLIRAYKELESYWKQTTDFAQTKLDSEEFYSKKVEILKNNIFGVDLDPKAVEITQLNLLLQISESKQRLPILQNNIKIGNSLIDDPNVTDKAFKWEEEFPEIIKNGGFDIVIGNPPYVQLSMEGLLQSEEREYLIKRFESSMGRLNTFGFFIRLGIDLLKEGGILGFIVPNTILTQDYYEELRKMILNSCKINSIVNFLDLPFKNAIVENVILISIKTSSKEKRRDNLVKIYGIGRNFNFFKQNEIQQNTFFDNNKTSFGIFWDKSALSLKQKIEQGSRPLSNFLEINQGIALKHDRSRYISKDKIDDSYKPILDGRNINRYLLSWDGNYLRYDLEAIHSSKREEIFNTSEKILFRRVGRSLIATFDNKKFYALNTLVVMNKKPRNELNILYFLAIFNSKLMNYYYRTFLKSTKRIFSEIQARQVKNLPIKIDNAEAPKLVELAQKMLNLNEQLVRASKETFSSLKLEEEIIKTDNQIDDLVYKIYGISERERNEIEKNF
ncbi:MAG: N-6 DNA methylase [Candidatus Thermoplasmatota archaeon]|jgi:type I restriction-modification system DNA methylase subunit|nr:N-6 DNA methylase [Candidatus Thermoplasmatota archaeon]MCL5788891.1 N-6 DNA methylase [Candidatus Thermoplasmatota archaeon]